METSNLHPFVARDRLAQISFLDLPEMSKGHDDSVWSMRIQSRVLQFIAG